MFSTRILVLAAIVLSASSINAAGISRTKPDKVARGFLTKSIEVGAKTCNYVVYVPPSYQPGSPIPAIVFLHGRGECGTDGLRQLTCGLGPAVLSDFAKWPFIILFPQKQVTGALWEQEDDMVQAELKRTLREFSIDKSRIYLTGLSQGGHGAFSIGALHTDVFAAIAPICGWADRSTGEKLANTPAWVFHGEADSIVNVQSSIEMLIFLRAATASPDSDAIHKLTLYPGVDHNSWDQAYRTEDLPGWFMLHHK